jgi:hypothetical protein
MLALLTQIELDRAENQANDAGQLLSHKELIKLGAAKLTQKQRDNSRDLKAATGASM